MEIILTVHRKCFRYLGSSNVGNDAKSILTNKKSEITNGPALHVQISLRTVVFIAMATAWAAL